MTVTRTAVPADIAASVLELTYGDLMEIATSLNDMHEGTPRDLDVPAEWAELLYTWARETREAEDPEVRP